MSVEHTLLVGVDGSPNGWHALDWAARESERTGRGLRVVQVDGEPGTAPGGVLHDAAAGLAARHPTVDVTTTLLTGDPAGRLVELSRSADLVVVGRGRRGISRLLHGSVANRVLAHAHCPVAVVAPASRELENRIVVGVSGSDSGRAAMRFAVSEAARCGAQVVAVRCWSTRDRWVAADEPVLDSTVDLWEAEERTALEDWLDVARDAFPSVDLRAVLSTTPLEGVLQRESAGAAMLVLGCRRPDDTRLGPVTAWPTSTATPDHGQPAPRGVTMHNKTTNRNDRPRLMRRIWRSLMLKTDDATPPAIADGWLRLASSGCAVQVVDARDDPLTSTLVTEDTCWLFAVEDWRGRQPRWWQRAARRAWLDEAAVLVAKRDRLLEATRQLATRKPPDKSARPPKLPG